MTRKKLFERGMSLFLSFAMLLGMVPAFEIRAEAFDTTQSNISARELTEKELLDAKEGVPNFPLGEGIGGYLTITDTIYTVGSTAHGTVIEHEVFENRGQSWAINEAFKEMRELGVYYGLDTNGKGTIYDGLAEPMFMNDIFGIALLYFWPGKNDYGFRTYRGADPSATRASVFRNAGEHIEGEFNREQIEAIDELLFNAAQNGEGAETRLMMMAVVCCCLEQVYGHSPKQFSATTIGKFNNGQDFKTVSGNTIPVFSDKEEVEGDYSDLAMQWINMALYYEVITGQAPSTGGLYLNPDGADSYVLFAEGLTMLQRGVRNATGGGGGGGGNIELSDIDADIDASEVYKEFNYKDFENGETVEVYVAGDTAGSYSALTADFDYSIEDSHGNLGTQSGSGKSFIASKELFSYTAEDFGEDRDTD